MAEFTRIKDQARHDESVKKQKRKLKIPNWKEKEDMIDGNG
jgi:hypothetical protein